MTGTCPAISDFPLYAVYDHCRFALHSLTAGLFPHKENAPAHCPLEQLDGRFVLQVAAAMAVGWPHHHYQSALSQVLLQPPLMCLSSGAGLPAAAHERAQTGSKHLS